MNLRDVPLNEIQDELQRRVATVGIPHPTLSAKPDFTEMIETCKQYMEFVESSEYHEDNDFREYIYEAAMIALYGKSVFAYVNSK